MSGNPNPNPSTPAGSVLGWLATNAFAIAILVLVFLVIAVLAFGLLSGTAGILDDISSTDTARGLITFIFAFGVISIAFILIISLFFSTAPDILNKFEKAKEVFTALIVILGTIMGFYFGVEIADEASSPQTEGARSEAGTENEAVVVPDQAGGAPAEGSANTQAGVSTVSPSQPVLDTRPQGTAEQNEPAGPVTEEPSDAPGGPATEEQFEAPD